VQFDALHVGAATRSSPLESAPTGRAIDPLFALLMILCSRQYLFDRFALTLKLSLLFGHQHVRLFIQNSAP